MTFDPTISLGNVMVFLVWVVAVFLGVHKIDKRIALIEQLVTRHERYIEKHLQHLDVLVSGAQERERGKP